MNAKGSNKNRFTRGKHKHGMEKRWLTERDLKAQGLASEKTLQDWRMHKNVGPPWRKFGRAVRYDAAEVEKWAAAQRGGGARMD
jgi:hypothetical protein